MPLSTLFNQDGNVLALANMEGSMSNLLVETQKLGQSIWYDNISRAMFSSGALKKMIDEGLRGMTSNPAIFEKSIDGGSAYDEQLRQLATSGDAKVVFEHLAISDIQHAADLFRPLYHQTQRKDGYVSLEVSPYLAHDMNATIDEARRLHRAVARENVMIKVPATREGISAIGALIADGINVNVTLLFALDAYEAEANAYLDGLERLAQNGGDLSKVASVASFFLSRIDTLIDDKLGERSDLRGKVAIACAKLAYVHYQRTLKTPRWKELEQKGATPQRLLWASTSTNNPTYRKTLYVDALIGPDTVNTVPPETYEAFKAHGTARQTLNDNVEQARETLTKLVAEGVNLSEVTDELLRQGVAKFSEPFDKLLAAVERKRRAALGDKLNAQSITLGQHKSEVDAIAADWTKNGNLRRLRLHARDYFAINAYLEMSEDNQRELEAIRHLVRDTRHVATTLGFGPRFLHSTGQLHKGGPNEGVFLEIVAEDVDNLPVPGERYGFSELKTAQAVGDYEALVERKRRVVRVDLSHAKSLATLRTMIEQSL